MQFLITLEETECGFSVQVPDLAIITTGENIHQAKQAAVEAISINLGAYKEIGKSIPPRQSFATRFENADYEDLLFAFVNVTLAEEKAVA